MSAHQRLAVHLHGEARDVAAALAPDDITTDASAARAYAALCEETATALDANSTDPLRVLPAPSAARLDDGVAMPEDPYADIDVPTGDFPTAPPGWILGVDVSGPSQQRIDAAALRAVGVEFLYAKATDGERSVDGEWVTTARSCRDAGLPLGAYHVLEPYGPGRAEVQAFHFANVVRDSGATLPPWLDFELAHGISGIDALRAAVVFRDAVEELLQMRVMVYTYPSFVEALERYDGAATMAVAEDLARSPLAVAHYTQSYAKMPRVPRPWSDWQIWQASGGRKVSRNAAQLPWLPRRDVDIDLFRGTVERLVALAQPAP